MPDILAGRRAAAFTPIDAWRRPRCARSPSIPARSLEVTTMPELNLNGYTDIPNGKFAAVVTYLQMSERPWPDVPSDLSLRAIQNADLAWYRSFYREIGEEWLWVSRLLMNDKQLSSVIHHPGNELFAGQVAGVDVGIVEIDRRDPADVEISFFGLMPEFVGRGAGRAMMSAALNVAWQSDTQRVWLHTCTLDHPGALSFYRRCGFVPYRRAIEVMDDPRCNGLIPATTAPRTPVI